jgi:hypothetical protein
MRGAADHEYRTRQAPHPAFGHPLPAGEGFQGRDNTRSICSSNAAAA